MSALEDRGSHCAPGLRQARLTDYAAIASVAEANGLRAPTEAEWRRMWIDNPLWPRVGRHWPFGWVLDRGGVVGSIVSIPTRYVFRGRELLCANGRGWNVLPEYRGWALWLMEEYLSQPGIDLFVNTTVGPTASPALEELAARVPAGDWTRVSFWVTDHATLSRRALERQHVPLAAVLAHPAAVVLKAGEALRSTIRSGPDAAMDPTAPRGAANDLAAPDEFDDRFDAFWTELVRFRPNTLLNARDASALRWHFDAARRSRRLWVFTASRHALLRAYMVCLVDQLPLGVRRAQVVDYQSVDAPSDPLPGLISAARSRAAREGVSVFEHLGHGLPKFRAFDREAPYSRVKPEWPQYYRTNDPSLAAELAEPRVWDPSLFDGDASLD